MIWLLGSVISTSLFLVIFKYFGKFNVQLYPAIVINYLTCFIIGNIHLGNANIFTSAAWNEPWFFKIVPLGLLFVGAFYMMGLSTRISGAGATSVAAKMSVVIPALFAIIFWKESFSWLQYIGVALSLVSVYLVSPDTPEEHKKHRGLEMLLLVFLGSGLVDLGLNVVKHNHGNDVSDSKISTLVFGGAAVLGSIIWLIQFKKIKCGKKEIVGGLILGATNYFSLIAMFGALDFFIGKTALFFAVNNIGVVLLSTMLAVIIFKEKIYRKEKIGLALAVLAIIMMNFYAVFG